MNYIFIYLFPGHGVEITLLIRHLYKMEHAIANIKRTRIDVAQFFSDAKVRRRNSSDTAVTTQT